MMCVYVYLVICVWVHGGRLHAKRGLRRLNEHVVHIFATRRHGPRFRTVVVRDILLGPGNPERTKTDYSCWAVMGLGWAFLGGKGRSGGSRGGGGKGGRRGRGELTYALFSMTAQHFLGKIEFLKYSFKIHTAPTLTEKFSFFFKSTYLQTMGADTLSSASPTDRRSRDLHRGSSSSL